MLGLMHLWLGYVPDKSDQPGSSGTDTSPEVGERPDRAARRQSSFFFLVLGSGALITAMCVLAGDESVRDHSHMSTGHKKNNRVPLRIANHDRGSDVRHILQSGSMETWGETRACIPCPVLQKPFSGRIQKHSGMPVHCHFHDTSKHRCLCPRRGAM